MRGGSVVNEAAVRLQSRTVTERQREAPPKKSAPLVGAFDLETLFPQRTRREASGSMRAGSVVNDDPVDRQSRTVTEPTGEKRLPKSQHPLRVLLIWKRHSHSEPGAIASGSMRAGSVVNEAAVRLQSRTVTERQREAPPKKSAPLAGAFDLETLFPQRNGPCRRTEATRPAALDKRKNGQYNIRVNQ